MLPLRFAEDIFLDFFHLVLVKNLPIQGQDYSPVLSFGQKIQLGENLTQNQANYIIKILDKYKNLSVTFGLDYLADLNSLQWKNPFRVLDLSKKIFVEKSPEGKIWICLRFPYQLKKEFEDEIIGDNNQPHRTEWDPVQRLRKISCYDCNLIHLYEFACKHNFEIDETFLNVLSGVEEIWQDSEELTPCAVVEGTYIKLKNAPESAHEYFTNHQTHHLLDDAFLAKSMGYPLGRYLGIAGQPLLRILSSPSNSFWTKENDELFKIYKCLSTKICVILDRTSNTLDWLKRFVADADKNHISRDDIKVCFREAKDNKSGLNEWVKLSGVGGKVDSGKIFIFESKPAKWLFKDIENVKILVTNTLYPPTNSLTRDWFQSHPCVIYLGNTKPTQQKGQNIVEL